MLATSRVAHRFGSGKLYICLNNKCFELHPVYSLCTDVRPSQDHWILCMQSVRINLATLFLFTEVKVAEVKAAGEKAAGVKVEVEMSGGQS